MDIIYINENGGVKTAVSHYDNDTRSFICQIDEKNFIISVIHDGVLVVPKELKPLEQYFCHSQSESFNLINPVEFSHAGRSFEIDFEALVIPSCCQVLKLPSYAIQVRELIIMSARIPLVNDPYLELEHYPNNFKIYFEGASDYPIVGDRIGYASDFVDSMSASIDSPILWHEDGIVHYIFALDGIVTEIGIYPNNP